MSIFKRGPGGSVFIEQGTPQDWDAKPQAMPISPLSLNQLTRDYYGQYDAAAIAQYAPLANDPCYQPKLYVAPDFQNQSMAAIFGVAWHQLVRIAAVLERREGSAWGDRHQQTR